MWLIPGGDDDTRLDEALPVDDSARAAVELAYARVTAGCGEAYQHLAATEAQEDAARTHANVGRDLHVMPGDCVTGLERERAISLGNAAADYVGSTLVTPGLDIGAVDFLDITLRRRRRQTWDKRFEVKHTLLHLNGVGGTPIWFRVRVTGLPVKRSPLPGP